MKTPLTVACQASDEAAMEAVAAIERIAMTARDEIQRLQVQVQRNLQRTIHQTHHDQAAA
jgi:hypothetical protein